MPSTISDPFRPVDLTIEYVDSVAGSRKTFTAVDKAVFNAKRHGTRTIFAMPTLKLIEEWYGHAKKDGHVPIYEITSTTKSFGSGSIESLICKHIASRKAYVGHLLFITHEGFQRVSNWPMQTAGFELYIDEVLEAVLSRKPFKLRDSHWVLTNFLEVMPVPTTIAERNKKIKGPAEFTYPIPGSVKKTDQDRLDTCEQYLQPESNASDNEIEMALKEGKRLLEKRDKWIEWLNRDQSDADRELAQTYYLVLPKLSSTAQDPMYWIKRRETAKMQDDIYEYLDPIAKWLVQGNALFTEMHAWNKAIVNTRDPNTFRDRSRGLITITGFRRPDALSAFGRVTIMSALFTHTMLHNVWQTLGVKFVRSEIVTVAQTTTDLGKRRLRIYWLTDEGWSKTVRNKSGGIEKILQLIKDSGVINPKQSVCTIVNKDNGSEQNPTVVTNIFSKGVVMPHNVRGQNRWQHHHQMIHCAALNSYTSDIRWMESVLGIDSATQRIGRTGQEIYQAMMRLSIRDPKSRSNITMVVMDKDVAEWIPQWFTGAVEVNQIDSSGVIRKKEKRGPKPIGDKVMTAAERKRRQRLKHTIVSVE